MHHVQIFSSPSCKWKYHATVFTEALNPWPPGFFVICGDITPVHVHFFTHFRLVLNKRIYRYSLGTVHYHFELGFLLESATLRIRAYRMYLWRKMMKKYPGFCILQEKDTVYRDKKLGSQFLFSGGIILKEVYAFVLCVVFGSPLRLLEKALGRLHCKKRLSIFP